MKPFHARALLLAWLFVMSPLALSAALAFEALPAHSGCLSETRLPLYPPLVPNGFVYSCFTCHSDGNYDVPPTSTQFRVDFFQSNYTWGPALAALDSDGDSFTNGEELLDPYGLWSPGDPAPGPIEQLSNPSTGNEIPSLRCCIEDRVRSLNSGWNAVSFSANPQGVATASDLAISAQGSNLTVTNVAQWQGTAWQIYQTGFPFNNFALEPGIGYFVFCNGGGDWEYSVSLCE